MVPKMPTESFVSPIQRSVPRTGELRMELRNEPRTGEVRNVPWFEDEKTTLTSENMRNIPLMGQLRYVPSSTEVK